MLGVRGRHVRSRSVGGWRMVSRGVRLVWRARGVGARHRILSRAVLGRRPAAYRQRPGIHVLWFTGWYVHDDEAARRRLQPRRVVQSADGSFRAAVRGHLPDTRCSRRSHYIDGHYFLLLISSLMMADHTSTCRGTSKFGSMIARWSSGS